MTKYFIMILTLSLTACATPRMIKERPDGGRVQVLNAPSRESSPKNDAMAVAKAETLIGKKCPNGYTEVERGFEKVGEFGTGAGKIDTDAFYLDFKCK